jgi:serine/threonine-protein kinase
VKALGCLAVVAALFMLSNPAAAQADCASDCQASYRSCRGNPDSCLSAQGVCLNRCTLGGSRERHGAIAHSSRKEVYGYSHDYDSAKGASEAAVRHCRGQEGGADDCRVVVTFHNACGALALGDRGAYGSAWALSVREASAKALAECRPHGGASCKITRQVCSGAGR